MNGRIVGIVFFVVLMTPGLIVAEIPQVISYQGKVTDSGGTPVPDGNHQMRFRMMDAPTGANVLWDSGTRTVAVSGGVFNVLLGESPQPVLSLEFDQDYWLLVTFEGVNQTPRQRLGSTGYAYMASGLVPGTEVIGSVTTGTYSAVKGTNTATTGITYGGWFESASPAGRGVHGYATATTGTTYGVYGESASTDGMGVYGYASATEGWAYGVVGEGGGYWGAGVYGKSSATVGFTYGVYGWSNSTSGTGVRGWAESTTGETYGVYGQSSSPNGRAVYGYASATTGETYGVYGRSSSPSGRAVYGDASATTGETYGVYGRTSSPDGYAGYFDGNVWVAEQLGLSNYDASGTAGTGSIEIGGSLRLDGNEIITNTDEELYLQHDNNGDLRVDNTTLVVDASLNRVGVLTASPAYPLDVSGAAHASSFPTSSDERLKTDIRQITGVLDRLERIRGVSFEWNELYELMGRSTRHREIGMIAQEVEAEFPELVTRWGEEEYRAVDYGRLTGVLIEAVRELRGELDRLRRETSVLREMNSGLNRRIETLEGSAGSSKPAQNSE